MYERHTYAILYHTVLYEITILDFGDRVEIKVETEKYKIFYRTGGGLEYMGVLTDIASARTDDGDSIENFLDSLEEILNLGILLGEKHGD